jgi:antitoxin HicB
MQDAAKSKSPVARCPHSRPPKFVDFATEDWTNPDGSTGFKPPSTLDELLKDPQFDKDARDAVVALIAFPAGARAAE